MSVHIQVEKNHVVVHSNSATLTDIEAANCVNAVKALIDRRPLVIFDFSMVQKTTEPALRTLTRVVSEVAQYEAKVAMVVQKPIAQFIGSCGLDRLFPCFSTIDEALSLSGASTAKEHTLEFLNTTLEAVSYTLKVATNTEASAGKTHLRNGDASAPTVDIGASVGIVSSPFNGTLIIAFPLKTYLGLMGRLLGKECTEIDPSIRDGAAELLNIILGQARATLNEKGYAIKQAIPTVVLGTNLQIFNFANTPSVIVPYVTDIGDFYIELTTRPTGTG